MSAPAISSLQLLNLGCGATIDRRWVNLDVKSENPSVMEHDLNRGIPFSEEQFDAVYLSHVLEHFSATNGQRLLRECFRVIKPSGIIRVVVPDLEGICRDYLSSLESAASGSEPGCLERDWMAIELLDQMVRERSGGVMAEYLKSPPTAAEEFVRRRIGDAALDCLKAPIMEADGDKKKGRVRALGPVHTVVRKIRSLGWHLQRLCRRALLGKRGMLYYDIGYFRTLGEVHLWMYDRVSLGDVLLKTRFVAPRLQTAGRSAIAGWKTYCLDCDSHGRVRKPDSLYMEAGRTLAS